MESATFNLIRPTLDSGRRKAMAGRMGGEANSKQSESKPKANGKQTVSEGEKEREKEKEGEIEIEKEIENECYIPPTPRRGGGLTEDYILYLSDFILDSYPKQKNDLSSRTYETLSGMNLTEKDFIQMKSNLSNWKKSEQWNKCSGQYIPLLSNWLSKGIWKTEPAKYVLPKGASGELGQAELDAIQQLMEE